MMSKETLNRLIKVFFWGTVITGVVLLASTLSHGSVSTKNTTCWLPEGCVTQYDANPLMYQAVYLATTPDAVSNIDGNLNLRVKPLGTYMLYDESVLLCGLPIDKFKGKSEPFVLTYERVSHHSVQGIGCHNLVRVDEIRTKDKVEAGSEG